MVQAAAMAAQEVVEKTDAPFLIAKHHRNGPAMLKTHAPSAPATRPKLRRIPRRESWEIGRVRGRRGACSCVGLCGCYPPPPWSFPSHPNTLRRQRGLVCFVGDDHQPRGLGRLQNLSKAIDA